MMDLDEQLTLAIELDDYRDNKKNSGKDDIGRHWETMKKKKRKRKVKPVLDGGTWKAVGNETVPNNWPNAQEIVHRLANK